MQPSEKSIAAAALLQRRRSRDDLLSFVLSTKDDFEVAAHHKLIASALQEVEAGLCKRLMIFCPPRHTKSELATRRFPAWYLGRHPNKQVISASYNSELATDFGREVRNIIGTPEYRSIFPETTLSSDSQAANRWHTDSGGNYIAAGVGTAITGRGADLGIIDDPVKDRQEADSELIRERIFDWYTSTFYTRLMPNASIVLIQTRWHEDDLAGRLLGAMEEGGEHYKVIDLPAIAKGKDPLERKEGEALWPEWYPEPRLREIQAVIGARDWSALYQQEPVSDEGAYFKKDWFKFYTPATLPHGLRIYGASDYATKDSEGDYTVHGVVGVDNEENIYILDWWRRQAESDMWVEACIDLMEKWKPLLWAEERGAILGALGPYITTRMRERRTYCVREAFSSRKDKATRARAIQARMAAGRLFFPHGAEWFPDVQAEMLSFPAGKHDDSVDVMGLFGRILEDMQAAGNLRNFHAHRHIRKTGSVANG